jgi:hypothetical protein
MRRPENEMGFYVRKSIKAGPFRYNLSKSGVGEAAITTNGAGYMPLENDFVFVTGFSPPSNLLDARQALSTIEGELLG